MAFSVLIIFAGTIPETMKAYARRVTQFTQIAIAHKKKKAASPKRNGLKGQYVPRISGDR